MGITIPECGFLIIKDSTADNKEMDSFPPGIIGMNIAKRCKELTLAEFDAALGGKLDSDWREAFQRVQETELLEKTTTCSTKREMLPPCSISLHSLH